MTFIKTYTIYFKQDVQELFIGKNVVPAYIYQTKLIFCFDRLAIVRLEIPSVILSGDRTMN